MKKNYIQPTIEVLKMQSTELLAGSDWVLNGNAEDDISNPEQVLSRGLDW